MPYSSCVAWEAVVGRGLAMCVHPYATWRTRSARARTAVLLAYVAAGYMLVLTLLLFVAPLAN